jgi:hypothetical protein
MINKLAHNLTILGRVLTPRMAGLKTGDDYKDCFTGSPPTGEPLNPCPLCVVWFIKGRIIVSEG